jgi:hypothetical protein
MLKTAGALETENMVRRQHYRRAPRGLRPMYAAARHVGGACRGQSCGSVRSTRRQSGGDAAGCRTGVEFTRATLAHDAAADEYREAIVKRWGRRALVSLAFAITAARIYPTTKYETGTESLSTSLKLMLASFGNNVAIVNLLPSSDWLAVGGGVDRRETRCVE